METYYKKRNKTHNPCVTITQFGQRWTYNPILVTIIMAVSCYLCKDGLLGCVCIDYHYGFMVLWFYDLDLITHVL